MTKVVLNLMMLSAFLIMASAAKAGVSGGTCGTNCNWIIENGTLKISGGADGEIGVMSNFVIEEGKNFENYDDSRYLTPWREHREEITAIDVQGVSNIGNYAFAGLGNATQISLGETVRSTGRGAFEHSTGFSTVVLPDSFETLGTASFIRTNLITLIAPDSVTLNNHALDYDFNNIRIICKGGKEKCNNLKKELEDYMHWGTDENGAFSSSLHSDISGLVLLAGKEQCNSIKYYWNGEECLGRPDDGYIFCADGYYPTNQGYCEIIKLRYTLPEADAATSNDNENMIEWIFE